MSSLISAQRRLWAQSLIRWLALGAGSGAIAGAMLEAALALGQTWRWDGVSCWALLAGALAGLLAGIVRRPSLRTTALALDAAADFKDRMHSALQFSTESRADAYRTLQIADAVSVLDRHPVSRLLPWRWPREGTWATLAGVLLVVTALLLPRPKAASASLVGAPAAVMVESRHIQEQIEELEQAGEQLESRELKELAARLRKALENLLAESRSADDAMLHLARMTAAVESAAAGFDPLLLEQALQALGEGLKGLEEFGPISQMLKNGQHAQAAAALNAMGQAVEAGTQAMPEAGGLAQERLAQLSKQAGAAGMGEMSESLGQISNAIQSGSKSQCNSGCCKLGSTIGQYSQRMQASSVLRSQLSKLSEHKESLCKKGGYCSACRSGQQQCKSGQCKSNGLCSGCKGDRQCQGGNCSGIKSGLASLSLAKSDSPSSSAGTAVSANAFGRATSLDGRRVREQVTGQIGEGDSETQTEHSPDGQQNAAARYRQIYAKYSKISDAVMDEEAIPLAHRQMIKTYFEKIHPDRVDAGEALKLTASHPSQ